MLKRIVFPVACIAMLGLGACASGHEAPAVGPQDVQPAPSSEARVHVRNNNWADVDVYVVRSGLPTRLGTVTSMQDGVFEIPSTVLAGAPQLQLLVEPIGGSNPFLTQPMTIGEGQLVDLRVENNLALSSYSVS